MPTPIPSGLSLGVAEPRDALRRFDSRQLLLPTFRWQDAWERDHARGFAVAGITKLSLLSGIYDEMRSTISEGRSLADFSSRMRSRLVKAGLWGDTEITDPASGETRTVRFDENRLRTIYEVNTRQSHAAGRWDRIERNKARQPYVMYRTMRDERVRASHRPWDGVVLPVDDPFWTTHYPPNGWRCRCTAFAVNDRDVERRRADGESIKTEAPPEALVDYVNPHTGEHLQVPRGIDPGFGFNPGQEPLDGVIPRALRETGFRVADFAPEADTSAFPAPTARPASLLLDEGLSEEQYVDAFMGAFGARRDAKGDWLPSTFSDATGEDLVIDRGLFEQRATGASKLFKFGRERFVQFIAEAIKAPDEIWLLPMFTQDGRVAARRRYLARFVIAGETQPLLAVFEWGADGWTAVTGFQVEREANFMNQRRGYLAYRRRT